MKKTREPLAKLFEAIKIANENGSAKTKEPRRDNNKLKKKNTNNRQETKGSRTMIAGPI